MEKEIQNLELRIALLKKHFQEWKAFFKHQREVTTAIQTENSSSSSADGSLHSFNRFAQQAYELNQFSATNQRAKERLMQRQQKELRDLEGQTRGLTAEE